MPFNYTFRADDISTWDVNTRDLVENRDRELELYASTIDSSFLNLNADNLTSGTVPSSRVTGSYTGITQIGTLSAGVASYSIGDTGPSGGKVFITPSTSGNTTGLYFEVAPVSAQVQRLWSQYAPTNYQSTSVPLAQFNTIGTGKSNTVAIVNQGNSNPDTCAAKYCDDYTYGGFSDWFLPSRNELTEIYTNRVILGNDFGLGYFWTSSESTAGGAYCRYFTTGADDNLAKGNNLYVRPVRSFSTIGLNVVGSAAVRTAATQDGVILTGRAGGTSDYAVNILPTTLTTNRTVTLPDVSGTAITTGNLSSITSVGTLGSLTVTGITTSGSFRQGTDYLSPYQGFRNAIINGDFRINQRGFTSSTTSLTYGFDRWFQSNLGGTVTMSAQTFTVGSPAATGFESANFCRLLSSGQSGSTNYAILAQRIEDVRTFANSTVTISFWAKAASGTPKVAIELTQNFGSGGSPSADVNTYGGQVTLSTSWARYSITIAVPNINSKTIGTTANTSMLILNIWTSAGATFNSRTAFLGLQNNTFDIWGVQVERGSVATPFEQRPIQTELALCQRYYYRFIDGTGQPIGLGMYTFTSLVAFYITFPVTMRIAPVLVSSTGTNYYVAGQGFTTDYFNSVTTSQMSNKVAYIYNGTEVSASAGAVYGIYSNDANASIAFNAEL